MTFVRNYKEEEFEYSLSESVFIRIIAKRIPSNVTEQALLVNQ